MVKKTKYCKRNCFWCGVWRKHPFPSPSVLCQIAPDLKLSSQHPPTWPPWPPQRPPWPQLRSLYNHVLFSSMYKSKWGKGNWNLSWRMFYIIFSLPDVTTRRRNTNMTFLAQRGCARAGLLRRDWHAGQLELEHCQTDPQGEHIRHRRRRYHHQNILLLIIIIVAVIIIYLQP